MELLLYKYMDTSIPEKYEERECNYFSCYNVRKLDFHCEIQIQLLCRDVSQWDIA